MGEGVKFNMVVSRGTFKECGTICCVMGWGDILFSNFRGRGPYHWLYSSSWADVPEADTAKAAAHRIWHWIAIGCPETMPEVSWPEFVARHPILECRSGAQEVLALSRKGGENA